MTTWSCEAAALLQHLGDGKIAGSRWLLGDFDLPAHLEEHVSLHPPAQLQHAVAVCQSVGSPASARQPQQGKGMPSDGRAQSG